MLTKHFRNGKLVRAKSAVQMPGNQFCEEGGWLRLIKFEAKYLTEVMLKYSVSFVVFYQIKCKPKLISYHISVRFSIECLKP